jgi:hypothetical protein
MTLSPLRTSMLIVAVAASASMSGCGAKNSYGAVEDGLRDWLTAVEAGDPAACDHEAARFDFHEDLLERHPELGGPGTTCAKRVERMSVLDLPSPDAPIDIPVWDPSGEALVEVTGSRGDLHKFWMIYDDGQWLVSGNAA